METKSGKSDRIAMVASCGFPCTIAISRAPTKSRIITLGCYKETRVLEVHYDRFKASREDFALLNICLLANVDARKIK